MEDSRTPQECLSTVVTSVQNWLDKEVCQNCALKLTADQLKLDYNTVEKVWIEHQVELLDNETALD